MATGKYFKDLTATTNINGLLGAGEKADGTPPGNKFVYSDTPNMSAPSDAVVLTEKAIIASVNSFESNIALIDQNLGNDTTGVVGNLSKPYATYNAMAADVTAAANGNKFIAKYSSGLHKEAAITLQPYVNIMGEQVSSSIIATIAPISLSSAFALADDDNSVILSNIFIGSQLILDLKTIGGTSSANIAFLTSVCGAEVDFYARNTNDTIMFLQSFLPKMTLSGGSIVIQSCNTIGGDVTFITSTVSGEARLNTSIFSNISLMGGSATVDNDVYIKNCRIDGAISIDGIYSKLYMDSDSIPEGGIIYTNGATASQVTYITKASAVGNDSNVTGVTVKDALNNINLGLYGSSLDNVLFVNKFGTDLAELNYPTGSGVGFIATASDFPSTFVQNDCYMIPNGVTVTDNDPTKTNTGLTFTGPIQISSDAVNSTYIERDGASIGKCLCSIGAALYYNYFATAPYPTIWCLDNATYYFPSGSAAYSSIFAPFATAQITGWNYLMNPGITYFDTVQVTPSGIDGCIMYNTTVANSVYEYHAKLAYTNSTSLNAGIFRNSSALNTLLEVYCGDILTPSSTQPAIVAQGSGGSPSRVSATINGKIKGRAITINTGANLVTITAGDKTELTTVESSGDVYVMANLDDVATIGSPVSRVVFGGNTFVQPNILSDGFRTTFDMVGAYSWFSGAILGNDGTYHGAGIFGRMQLNNGSGVKTAYITTVGGEDNLFTQPIDTRGGFKDISLNAGFTAILLADSGNQSFTTTNKTIVGAVNEVKSTVIEQIIDVVTVTSNGQTSFPAALSQVPKARVKGSGLQVSGVYINGIGYKVYGTDFSLSGTGNKDLIWLNAYSIQTTDTALIEYYT